MNPLFRRFCGVLLIMAGLSLSLAGVLFPYFGATQEGLLIQAMATDPLHLGGSLFCQIVASVCLMIAVLGLQRDPRARRSKTMRVGAVLLILGVLGLGQHVWSEWSIYQNVSGDRFLFEYLFPHLPHPTQMRLPLFFWILYIGSTVYSAGFYHIDATGVWPKRLLLLGLAWGLLGSYLASAETQALFYHGFLLCFTIAYCWLGFEVCFRFRPSRPKALAPAGREHLFD